MGAVPQFEVEFAEVAKRDLLSIVERMADDDPVAAGRVLDQLESRVASLNRMPGRGRVVPELATFGIGMYRELIVAPWRLIYRIDGMKVYVLAVLDGRRNVEDVLLDRLIR